MPKALSPTPLVYNGSDVRYDSSGVHLVLELVAH